MILFHKIAITYFIGIFAIIYYGVNTVGNKKHQKIADMLLSIYISGGIIGGLIFMWIKL